MISTDSVDVLTSALEEIKRAQPEMLATLRKHRIVFDDIGADPRNWQHVAFTIYTALCEVDSIAQAALGAVAA